MRRSGFLCGTAGAMAAAALPTLCARAAAAETVDYSLTAAPIRFAPNAMVSFAGLAYNGAIPGPLLRVRYGQRVRVRYTNRTPVPTTVHWHGMILPNAMDGVPGVTQPAVEPEGTFLYEFEPKPPGTRWYHDHTMHMPMGLFGMFVVEDPKDDPADAEFALIFHDVPDMRTFDAAQRGVSTAAMLDPVGSPEMAAMRANDRMGDEVSYTAHCINGASYPGTRALTVKVGQRVRLRVLNANPTQTRYVRLADHRLRVTHADGNPLVRPIEVDALRIGVGERYDAWFEVTKPGAWLLQGISSDPLAYQQAVVVHTAGMENAAPQGVSQSLAGVDYFTYEKAAGLTGAIDERGVTVRQSFELGGGAWNSSRWTINNATWPNTPKIFVRSGDRVLVHFKNATDMDHPMHLHGHVFHVAEINGKALLRPLAKDVALVPANGGTMTWILDADSPAGRWLLHCHNEVHMMDGMMTELVYRA